MKKKTIHKTYYSYSLDKRGGSIKAETPNKAARCLLKSDTVIYCRGNYYNQPWIYVSDPSGKELKLWKIDEDLGPSQWEMDMR